MLRTTRSSPLAPPARCRSTARAITPAFDASPLHVVRSSHDVGGEPGDERFRNRTEAATRAPAPMRTRGQSRSSGTRQPFNTV